MIFGPTQSAVAKAIADNIEEGVISKESIRNDLMILKIFVSPNALDRQKLYDNNYQAVDKALKGAFESVGGD